MAQLTTGRQIPPAKQTILVEGHHRFAVGRDGEAIRVDMFAPDREQLPSGSRLPNANHARLAYGHEAPAVLSEGNATESSAVVEMECTQPGDGALRKRSAARGNFGGDDGEHHRQKDHFGRFLATDWSGAGILQQVWFRLLIIDGLLGVDQGPENHAEQGDHHVEIK